MITTEIRVKSIADKLASNRNYHRKLKKLYIVYTTVVCVHIRLPYASIYDIHMQVHTTSVCERI